MNNFFAEGVSTRPVVGEGLGQLIGLIYDDVTHDPPWQRTLEQMRVLLRAQTVALEVTVGSPHLKSYFFAAGIRAEDQHIAEWERWSEKGHVDLHLHAGDFRVFNDITEMSGRQGFLEMTRKYQVGSDVSLGVLTSDDAEYELHVTRSKKAALLDSREIKMLQDVVPHLSRAIELRSRLASARSIQELQGQTLDRIGLGGILIDPNGAITLLNQTAENILGEEDGLILKSGVLRATDRRCGQVLSRQLKHATQGRLEKTTCACSVRTLAIARPSGRRDLSLFLHRRLMLNHLSGRRETGVLMLILDPEARIVQSEDVFRQLFHFTETEAKIAVQLANGVEFDAIRHCFDIKMTTLRTHIQSMYDKTNVRRQHDLTRILVTTGAPLGAPFH